MKYRDRWLAPIVSIPSTKSGLFETLKVLACKLACLTLARTNVRNILMVSTPSRDRYVRISEDINIVRMSCAHIHARGRSSRPLSFFYIIHAIPVLERGKTHAKCRAAER